MDLLDFEAQPLYFDVPPPAEISDLIQEASERYGDPEAEALLLRAYFLAPRDYTVLVAVYRYYFYQRRLDDTRLVALRVLDQIAAEVGLPADWRQLDDAAVTTAAERSMTLTRFYLSTLKADGYLLMRMGRLEEAIERLEKLVDVDDVDRMGGRPLLELARKRIAEERPTPKLTLVSA